MARANTYPDDLRDRLVAAASARLRHEAPEKMSLRDLAASVDTSTNAIYSIFGGKEELIAAVLEAAKPGFVACQTASYEGEPSLDAVREAMAAYRQWALANPWLYRLMVGGDRHPGAFAIGAAEMQVVYDGYAALMERGEIRTTDPVAMSTLAWTGLHGFVQMELGTTDLDPDLREQLFAQQVDFIIRGMVPHPELD